MRDRFDGAAQMYVKALYSDALEGRDQRLGYRFLAQSLRRIHNAAIEAAAEAVRTNTLVSGSNGPLMDMGWNAANKAGADAILKLRVES